MVQSAAARFVILSILAVTPLTDADLAAAIRRSGQASPVQLPAGAALREPITVKLQRTGAELKSHEVGTSFYIARIAVGSPPQELRVIFDTGAGSVLLPHRACKSEACQTHRRFSPWQSSTAMDVGIDGGLVQKGQRLAKGAVMRDVATIGFSQSDLGEGEAKTVLVRDNICLPGSVSSEHGNGSARACVDMPLLAAISMDEKPFLALPADGIIGLGMEALSPAGCSFLAHLFEGATGVSRTFGIHLGSSTGEVSFGGINSSLLSEPLVWLPVHDPASGYWQVAIRQVRLGSRIVDACSHGCHGVVDTGASRLGVQHNIYDKLSFDIARSLQPSRTGSCVGPSLELDLGDMVLRLDPEDYSDSRCEPLLGALTKLEEPEFVGVYALGTAIMRHYYAAFDVESQRIGFARAASAAMDVNGKDRAPLSSLSTKQGLVVV